MTSNAQDSPFLSPELDMVMKILSQCYVPKMLHVSFEHNATTHEVTISNMGINPAVALQTLRHFGIKGIMHSVSTLHFWKVSGPPQHICDAFNDHHQDGIFDVIEHHITQMNDAS